MLTKQKVLNCILVNLWLLVHAGDLHLDAGIVKLSNYIKHMHVNV